METKRTAPLQFFKGCCIINILCGTEGIPQEITTLDIKKNSEIADLAMAT